MRRTLYWLSQHTSPISPKYGDIPIFRALNGTWCTLMLTGLPVRKHEWAWKLSKIVQFGHTQKWIIWPENKLPGPEFRLLPENWHPCVEHCIHVGILSHLIAIQDIDPWLYLDPSRTIPHHTGIGHDEWFYWFTVVLVGSCPSADLS